MTFTNKLQSFGIIPLYKDGKEILTVIVKHKQGHWGLPKGTPDPGEGPLKTALRELKEETGIEEVELVKDISFKERYHFSQAGRNFSKEVIYYLGWVKDRPKEAVPFDDIVEIKWLPLPAARKSLTYPEAREILRQIESYLKLSKLSK